MTDNLVDLRAFGVSGAEIIPLNRHTVALCARLGRGMRTVSRRNETVLLRDSVYLCVTHFLIVFLIILFNNSDNARTMEIIVGEGVQNLE